MKRTEGRQKTHQITSLERRAGQGRLDSNGGGVGSSWGSLDGGIAVATRGQTYGPFVLLLPGDDPMLVASPLLLLLDEDLAVIRTVFNEEDEEDGEDEGETTSTEEERDVLMVEGNFGGGEWFNLATASESKGE